MATIALVHARLGAGHVGMNVRTTGTKAEFLSVSLLARQAVAGARVEACMEDADAQTQSPVQCVPAEPTAHTYS